MPTVTSNVLVLEPLAFVALNVKVLLPLTGTLLEVSPVTTPTPWSMERLVAPVAFQANKTLPPPEGKLLGVAVKLEITGLAVATTGETIKVSVFEKFASPADVALT